MLGIKSAGNIFLVDANYSWKSIIYAILTALLAALLRFILVGELVNISYVFIGLATMIVAAAIWLLFRERLLIFKFLRRYLKFNWLLLWGISATIIISSTFVYFSGNELYGWITAVLWFLSGSTRALIQFSEALFNSELGEFMQIIRIYAYSRIAVYSIGLVSFFSMIPFLSNLPQIVFYGAIFLLTLCLMANLYPYATRHQNIRKVIKLIRLVGEQKLIKVNRLRALVGFSQKTFDKIWPRLVGGGFFHVLNKRVQLSKGYKYLYRISR